MQFELHLGLHKEVFEGIVSILTEGDKPLYPGIDQHLGTEDAGRMGDINSRARQVYTVKSRLDDYILLRMNGPAYLMPRSGGYTQVISQTAEFKTILYSGGSSIIPGR